MKLEINCPFIHTPITCICNIELPWSKFPLTILYSLSLILFKGWECLASSFNVQCLFYPTFLLLAPFSPCVLGQCLHYYTVAFLGRCAQVFQIYSSRKITDPHFQGKNVTHLSPSSPGHITAGSSNCSDKTEFQTTTWCLQTKASVRSRVSVLSWRYCISRAYQLKYQAWWKWPNTFSLRYSTESSCSGEPSRLLSFSLHARADTQAVLAQFHQ